MPGFHGAGCNCRDEATSLGALTWINPTIEIDQVTALNVESGDIKKVLLKTYEERLQDELGSLFNTLRGLLVVFLRNVRIVDEKLLLTVKN